MPFLVQILLYYNYLTFPVVHLHKCNDTNGDFSYLNMENLDGEKEKKKASSKLLGILRPQFKIATDFTV